MKKKITDHSETRNIDESLHGSPLQAHQILSGQQIDLVLVIKIYQQYSLVKWNNISH